MVDSNARMLRVRVVIVVLSLLGLVLSYIALEHHIRYAYGFATGPTWCNINAHFNCEAVNASAWSSIFGIPVASYGLFFYSVILVGSLAVSASAQVFSQRAWSGILLVLSAGASLASLALFAISEFLIGSLCLVCLGLYLVNFSIFGFAWRSGWVGQVRSGLVYGVREILRLVGVVFGVVTSPVQGGAWIVRALALLVVCCGVASIALPTALFNSFAASAAATNDPVARWRAMPVTTFDLNLSKGAFADYHLGNISAPIQVVEFADYECPACQTMSRVLKKVLAKYEGRYLFVFKNYPLDKSCNAGMEREAHRYACTAAYFSRCAGEQGKFWEALEVLFLRDADSGELTLESLIGDASKELSLDEEGVKECMNSGRYHEKIKSDIEDGNKVGLQGTPSVWINGKLVVRPTAEALEKICDAIIAAKL